MRILTHRLRFTGDAVDAFDRLFRGDDHAWWLDSALAGQDSGRFSCMGSADGPLARIAVVEHDRPTIRVRDRAGTREHPGDLLDFVAADLARFGVEVDVDLPFGFRLGWVGHLGYELGSRMLTGLAEPDGTAGAVLVFADRAVVVDTPGWRAWVLALTDDTDEVTAAQQAWLVATVRALGALNVDGRRHGEVDTIAAPPPNGSAPYPPASADDASAVTAGPLAVTLRHPREAYLDLIHRCQEHIAAGDSYELCLTNRITVRARTDPWELYRRLRRTSSRPFAAYLAFERAHVLSASPERFLSISADGRVEAKPIKGTRPRGATPSEDRRLVAELASDEKELAENLMIVDLLRNDLNRVCVAGSVHVPVLFEVETFPGVHQLVSTVRGRLAARLTAVDAVRSALPGGSMTGAPKHRSVQLLHELEAGPRGVYSGVIGYFSLTGGADWSIVIRSIEWHPDHLVYGIGGAITADSVPEAEWDETVIKARTLGSALGVDLDEVLPSAGPEADAPSHPATAPGTHRWDRRRLHAASGPEADGQLLVADSWRQQAGRVRDLDRHSARFAGGVAAVAPGRFAPGEVEDFVAATAALVPPVGEWFPRVRLVRDEAGATALLADLRVGPARRATARVRVLAPGDPRSRPRIKGPDLTMTGRLIAGSGADEVLIRGADATVLEAGYAAVVWWDGDVLVVPSPDLPILPSITRALVEQHAHRRGIPVREVSAGIEALDGREAWLLNAYQGVRLVTAWVGADIVAGPGVRFAHWRGVTDAR